MSALTDALAGMELTEDLPEGEMVSDAVVIVRLVHQETGRQSFTIALSGSIDYVTELGLIIAAHDAIRTPARFVGE